MASDSAAWTLDSVAPPDNTFRSSSEEVRRAFWRFIATKGVERFTWRCNRGIGANGRELTGIAVSTAAKGRWRSYTGAGSAANPPLVPALGRSRFEDLFRGRGFSDHAEWYWGTDPVTGLHWGQVALWHRAGGGGRYPVRDVIGWSEDDIDWLRSEGSRWWYAYQEGQRVAEHAQRLELPPARVEQLRGAHGAHELPPPPHVPGTTPAARELPPKIAVTGRLDIEHMTPGPLADLARTKRAIAEGYHSGFSRVTRGKPTIFRTPGAPPAPGPAPAPRPAPAPKPKPAVAAAAAPKRPALDLAGWAARAKEAAASVDSRRRVGDKVFIADAHAAYVERIGPIHLSDFKSLLSRSLQARHIDLSRADLIEGFDPEVVAASLTYHPMSDWEAHFIRL